MKTYRLIIEINPHTDEIEFFEESMEEEKAFFELDDIRVDMVQDFEEALFKSNGLLGLS